MSLNVNKYEYSLFDRNRLATNRQTVSFNNRFISKREDVRVVCYFSLDDSYEFYRKSTVRRRSAQ